jgi:hypothetical protein
LGGLLQQLPQDCLQLANGQQKQHQERPCVEQQAQPVPHPTQQAAAAADAAGRERLLCRVLCGVLSTSRVLPQLLSLQQLDTLDVAGTHALFLEALQLQGGEGGGSAQQQASEGEEEQLTRLRDYLTAATAKDCALMITLQQVVRSAQQQEGASDAEPAAAASGTCALPSRARVYEDAASGACFAWQLSLVDLDLKPLAKLPLHWQLDCEIMRAAEARRGALHQHAVDSAAWRVAAVEHLQQQRL